MENTNNDEDTYRTGEPLVAVRIANILQLYSESFHERRTALAAGDGHVVMTCRHRKWYDIYDLKS